MTVFSSVHTADPLPLIRKQFLQKPLHWTGIWENLSRKGPAVLLESSGAVGDASEWVILAGGANGECFSDSGRLRLEGSLGAPPFSDIWEFLDTIGFNEIPFAPFPHSLSRAWFGIFSYEFGKTFMPLRFSRIVSATKKSVPDFYFFKPKLVMAFNRETKEFYIFGENKMFDDMILDPVMEPFVVGPVDGRISSEKYESMVRDAQKYISSGDIYQANLAQSFRSSWRGNVGSLYGTLREMNPGPFMGAFRGNTFTVISSSPERLVTGRGDRLETRPIAGTRPRGNEEVQDLQFQWDLKTNRKEQAEHLMLVDLARNDLGKVSQYGTVEVKCYAEVESYARVHHLVSTIQAHKKNSVNVSDVFRSLFPGGTITGCPKIRCMEIIEELEEIPRGFYTGSMGYLAPGPSFDFNILIRSFTLFDDRTLDFYAGAGIVADSNPRQEYVETLYKVEALALALGTSLVSKI